MADARSDVAERYAAAFFELAKEEGAIAPLETDLTTLETAVADSEDLRRLLNSPIIESDVKLSGVKALLDKMGAHQLTQNLLAVLGQNNRLAALADVAAVFRRIAADDRGEVSAEAISARPLSDEQSKALRGQIESSVGKAVNLKTSVDATLLGGLIVKVGSRMIDSSLRTKLNRLQQTLKEA